MGTMAVRVSFKLELLQCSRVGSDSEHGLPVKAALVVVWAASLTFRAKRTGGKVVLPGVPLEWLSRSLGQNC